MEVYLIFANAYFKAIYLLAFQTARFFYWYHQFYIKYHQNRYHEYLKNPMYDHVIQDIIVRHNLSVYNFSVNRSSDVHFISSTFSVHFPDFIKSFNLTWVEKRIMQEVSFISFFLSIFFLFLFFSWSFLVYPFDVVIIFLKRDSHSHSLFIQLKVIDFFFENKAVYNCLA